MGPVIDKPGNIVIQLTDVSGPGKFYERLRWGWPAIGPETTPFEPDLVDASVGNTDASVIGIRCRSMRPQP